MAIVNIPDVGRVRFPAEMSAEEISKAAGELYDKYNPRARYESELGQDAQIRRQERALAGPEEDKQAAGIYEAPARIAKGAVESVGKSVEGVARGVDMVSTEQLNEPQFYAQKLAEVNRQAFPKGVDANTTLLQLADVPKETLADWQREYRKQFGSQAERLDRSAVAQMGRRIVAGAPTVDPTRDKEFKSEVLAGIGSTGPVIALSAIPGIGPGVAGVQYGLGAAEDAAQEAQELGGTETQAEVAFLGNMAVGGLSEALIGVGPRLWSIIRKVREAGVKPEAFGRVVLKAAREGALRESAQEGLEQLASNVIASDVAGYDPQRPAGKGVARSAAVGGTVGGLMGGGAGILSKPQNTQNTRKEDERQEPVAPAGQSGAGTETAQEPVVEEQQVVPGANVPSQTSREVVVRGGVPVNRQTGQVAPAGEQAKAKRGPAASQEEAMGALRNSVLPPGFELKVQPGQKVEAVDVEGTLRERAREFDKLILQYGLEEGWVQNPEIAYDESSSLGGQQGTASIKARILRQKEMASARRRAAIQITGNADIDLSNTRSKADLLPKLKEFVAQKYEVPAKQLEAWERAQVKRPGKEEVRTNELVVGDKLKQGTEVLKVSAVDPDTGEVTLDDGVKFGRQVMPEGSVFYVEAVAEAGQSGEWETGEGEPQNTQNTQKGAGPKLRAMEKQGDLMAQQTEEFKLAQDEATDFDRVKAEQEQRARDKAESEARQGDMFGGGRTAYGQKASAYPGGPLGTEPAQSVADDREYSALPIEFPELVRMARDLMGGQYPKLKERIRVLGGRALGVFFPMGKGRIELRRDLFDLLTSSEKEALMAEAEEYARNVAESEEELASITRERYEYLLEQAYEKAKRENPLVASKVLAHEIGHLVDYLPQGMISGRGNLLGRIASLKNFLKHTLPTEPGGTGKPITPAERAALKREAEKQLKEELGPIQEIIETIMVEEPEYRIVGITVEDVKRLLGMDARESMPELYLWFAQQDSAVKKEILKAAMKGVIDERIAAMGRREQTGTRRTEKTIRKVSGRAPTVAEIRQRFQELLRAEMEKRRLLDLKELKAELEPLIAWWRGTEKMEDYFKPSEEMYAEAFSIFLNNPAAMEKRAPKYFRALLAYMERKPEVAKLWQEIQNSIKSGTIMKERVESLRNSWEADNEASLAQAGRRWAKSATDWLDNVLYHVDRRFGPVYRLAKKAGGAVEGRAREAIGSFLYRASEHELFLGRMNREVGVPLVAANLDWNDLGEFMFHQHIINNRFNLANPMGWTSKTSLERLEEMRKQMGEPAWQALNSAHGAFRKLYETQVVELLRSSGLTSPELQQAIDERVFYATFAAIKGKAEAGIDQLLDDSFGNGTGAAIYKQVGNLGDIKQPATATVLKALSLISAAYRNQAKRATVEVIQQADPTMIRPADTTWDGKRRVPVERNTDKVGTIIVMEGGRPQAYYVPKVMADSLNQANPVQNLLEAAAIEANGFVKGLYTQHNYAFWPVNFIRDTFGWIMMMPKAGPIDYARVFVPAVKAARASLKARVKNVNAERALERKMLISRASYKGLDAAENEFEQKLQAFGLDPAMWDKQSREVSKLVRFWNTYKELGQTFERVNKLAGMLYLDRTHASMPEWQKREIVRERAGSPDFLQKGASASRIDLLMMFFNPWKEGIRSLAKSAKENPLSFTGKVATAVMLPSITQALATLGFLGDDLEEEYASIPDYDLSNYLVIPLGWANKEQKQVAYLRLPLWEPARLMHGLVTTAITGRGQTAVNRVGGQIPGGNAWWKVGSAWVAHEIQGRNPYDSFMGREVLDPSVFQARGAQARWDLAKYSWNELGGSIIHRFRDQSLYDAPEGEVQEFLNAPVVNNLLGRWIKVSSRGIDDADRKRAEPVLQERAVTRLAVREMAEKILANPPQALTEDEKRVLADSYAMDYLMTILPVAAGSQASPLLRRLNKAGTREEKEMILSNP